MPPSEFAETHAEEFATTSAGSTFSSRCRPAAALVEKLRRESSTSLPALTIASPAGPAPGTHEITSPAPYVTMPARPMLRTQASTTWAMVEKPATEFSPAIAAASATCWTSDERAMTHSAEAAAKTSEKLTRSARATATDVYPPSSSMNVDTPRRGTNALSPDSDPVPIVSPHPARAYVLLDANLQYHALILARSES